jgi:hypothetical protein
MSPLRKKFAKLLIEPIDQLRRSRNRSPSPSASSARRSATAAPSSPPPVAQAVHHAPQLTPAQSTTIANIAPSQSLPAGPSSPAVVPLCNLWDETQAKLPAPQQAVILQSSAAGTSAGSSTPATAAATKAGSIDIASLCALAAKQRDACEKGQWKVAFRGHQIIILRDTTAKILAWLDKFKQVGDVAVQYDPQHFALPWAGVRFLLEV